MKIGFKQLLAAGIFSACAITPVFAMDLLEVYQTALVQDASLQLAKQNYLVGKESEKEAKGLLRPSVTASARLGHTMYKSDTPNYAELFDDLPSGCFVNQEALEACARDYGQRFDNLRDGETKSDFNSSDINVSLAQPLYDKERWHSHKKAKLIQTRSELMYKQAKADLVYRVAESYLTALQAMTNLEQGKAQQSALNQQLKYAQSQLQMGVGRASDLYDLRSSSQLQRSQEHILKTGLMTSLAELSALTGKYLNQNEIERFVNPIPVTRLNPASEQAWVDLAKQFNLQMLDAGIEIQLANEDYQIKRAARWPKINFIANYNRTENSGGSAFVPGAETTVVGVDVRAPLYQGGAINAGKRRAQYQYEAAKQKQRQTFNKLEVTVRALYQQIDANVYSYGVLRDSLNTARKGLRTVSKGASKGLATVPEVMRSRKQVSELKSKIEALRFEYLLNKLKLRQLVGVLNEQDLQALNTLTR